MLQKVTVIFLIFLFYAAAAFGQTCFHSDLSRSLDFEVRSQRFKTSGHELDSCIVTVEIIKKMNKSNRQIIRLTSRFVFEDAFTNCSNARSYVTGKNKNKQTVDNDYGDFVVADLNFDGREDVAIKNDSGGNAGPTYNFYLQDITGKFLLNTFMTERIEFFPKKFNKAKKTLVTYTHAGACRLGECIYLLEVSNNKWAQTSHRIIDICK